MKRIRFLSSVALCALALAVACGDQKKPGASSSKPPEPGKSQPSDASGHHGKMIELGSGSAGPFPIRASRDEGAIKAGGEAPIDVWVNGGPKVTAVRFWVGVESAKGSVKALASIEDPAQPNHWHTHTEIPDPLPAGSKLWVEIEGEGGAKGTASFDLKG